MDELDMLRQARRVPAPPTAEALQAGRARLIEATRQPVRRRSRQMGGARRRERLAVAHGTPRRHLRPVAVAAGSAVLAGAALAAAVVAGGPSAPSRSVGQYRPGQIVTAAWTIQVNQDRTVTITVRQLRDPEGLQQTLRREGIPAIVRYIPMVTEKVGGQLVSGPACGYTPPRPAFPSAISRAVIVSGPGGSSTASLARPTPSSSALLRPTPSASPMPTAHMPTGSTPLIVLTIRPQAMPEGAAVLLDDSIAKSGAAVGGFGVSLLASDHLPPCVPFHQWLRH
jgi:hypothetical protein